MADRNEFSCHRLVSYTVEITDGIGAIECCRDVNHQNEETQEHCYRKINNYDIALCSFLSDLIIGVLISVSLNT